MEVNRKEAKVHMLPTEIKGGQGHTLWTNESGQLLHTKTSSNHLQGQHLYFTTDEKIKEGDWFYNGMNKIVVKATNRYSEMKNPIPHRKIIATTDKLGYCIDEKDGLTGYYLPQPSQAFIKAYCEQGGIDEVDVEYDVITNTYDNIADLMCPHSVAEYEQTTSSISKLKVDPVHNTITTHLIVEKMYSIDDIKAYCDKYPNDTELGREIRKLRYRQ